MLHRDIERTLSCSALPVYRCVIYHPSLFILVNEATQQHIPEAIKERRRREAEKKQRKDELLALTAYEQQQQQLSNIPAGKDKLSDVPLAIEDERRAEPPPDDQYTVAHPYAAALDM